ncbi:hypothetical protein T484DRAFT_1828082 [Baffinella frigidus]|nr:hypothetical protein T484DRAFT_1828082 [Cryptophyta sp. CCMP2293]
MCGGALPVWKKKKKKKKKKKGPDSGVSPGGEAAGGGEAMQRSEMLRKLLRECVASTTSSSLLFLEKLEDVSVSAWHPGDAVMTPAKRVGIQQPVSAELRKHRTCMTRNAEWKKFNLLSVFGSAPALKSTFSMTTTEAVFHDFLLGGEAQEKDKAPGDPSAPPPPQVEQWLICSTLGSKAIRKMALERKDMGLVPLGSVAALLKSSSMGVAPEIDGQIFAFSPAARSGLPVHVNGFFDASHGLAWPEECSQCQCAEQDVRIARGVLGVPVRMVREVCGARGRSAKEEVVQGQGATISRLLGKASAKWREACEWNRELFGCVVEAYLDLLSALPGVFRNDASVMYQMWPSSDNTRKEFRTTVHRPLYRSLSEKQLFLHDNGTLSKMQGGVFKPREANDSLRLLFRKIFPMFQCSLALSDEFRAAGVHDVSEITPERVREKLKKDPGLMDACQGAFTRADFSQAEAAARFSAFVTDALEYCLLDLSAHSDIRSQQFRALIGARLLPLANGSVFCFPFDAIVASEQEQALMPSMRDSFVDPKCSERLTRFFSSPDFLSAVGLQRFTPAVLALNLASVLPRHWKGKDRVQAFEPGGGDTTGLPAPEWFVNLWNFAGPENLHLFTAWPAAGDEEAKTRCATACQHVQTNPVLTALQRLGCAILHPAVANLVPRPQSFAAAAASSLARLEANPAGEIAGNT